MAESLLLEIILEGSNALGNRDYHSFFEELLSVYWLRPETALWRSIDIQTTSTFNFNAPSLEIGCGDGIFSFIRGGGRFDISFDAFQSIKNPDLDYYFKGKDIFDSFTKHSNPIVIRKPEYFIDCGLDYKKNLLKKARSLGLYKKLVLGDANKVLPFEDNYFKSIFSNIIYWLNSPADVFREINRILYPGGRCLVVLPNSNFPEYSFYYQHYLKKNNSRFNFLEKLDRGRIKDNLKHAKSGREWEKIIKSSGLKILSHEAYLSKTVIQIWDIGLRPIFPLLYRMVQNIKREELLKIKKEWIKTFKMFLEPIFLADKILNNNEEPAFHCFILTK